jgi:hypothetical protein
MAHYQRWLKHGDVQADRPKNMTPLGVCTVEECEKKRVARGLCQMHYERKRKKGDVGSPFSSKGQGTLHTGYNRVAINGKRRLKQCLVMEAHIERPLFREETVHHKDGDRLNNVIKNLELWSSRHGKGQRVEDKIDFCKSFLTDYGIPVPTLDPSFLLAGAMACV